MKQSIENIDLLKYVALKEEFETAEKLIRIGLGELQNINLDNDFYFLPFQLLSQGIERFLKAYICVGHFVNNGEFPSTAMFRGLGHDLEKLLEYVKQNYFTHYQYVQFELDWRVLSESTSLKELIYIMSEFGKLARYHNIDFVIGNTKIGINPKEAWREFEERIKPVDDKTINKLLSYDLDREVFPERTQLIIITFEKFIAALSRQIVYDSFGRLGKEMIFNSFFQYGTLYENDFGKTDYRKNTTKFCETPKSVHKRTIVDSFNRRFNSNYKSKVIRKDDYEGEWPFLVDEVIIECRYKHWCIVTIGGFDYALNGSAKGRYKLENPYDAGMAILGTSIGDFISMALAL